MKHKPIRQASTGRLRRKRSTAKLLVCCCEGVCPSVSDQVYPNTIQCLRVTLPALGGTQTYSGWDTSGGGGGGYISTTFTGSITINYPGGTLPLNIADYPGGSSSSPGMVMAWGDAYFRIPISATETRVDHYGTGTTVSYVRTLTGDLLGYVLASLGAQIWFATFDGRPVMVVSGQGCNGNGQIAELSFSAANYCLSVGPVICVDAPPQFTATGDTSALLLGGSSGGGEFFALGTMGATGSTTIPLTATPRGGVVPPCPVVHTNTATASLAWSTVACTPDLNVTATMACSLTVSTNGGTGTTTTTTGTTGSPGSGHEPCTTCTCATFTVYVDELGHCGPVYGTGWEEGVPCPTPRATGWQTNVAGGSVVSYSCRTCVCAGTPMFMPPPPRECGGKCPTCDEWLIEVVDAGPPFGCIVSISPGATGVPCDGPSETAWTKTSPYRKTVWACSGTVPDVGTLPPGCDVTGGGGGGGGGGGISIGG